MLRNKILSKQDFKLEAVEVPEWDATVYVRSFTAGERAKLMSLWKKHEANPAELNVHLVIMAVCDQSGQRVFDEADFDQLNQKNASVIDKVAVAALKVNGLDNDSVAAAKND